MKVNLNVRHRPNLSETVDQKFSEVLSSMRRIGPPWGIDPTTEVILPAMGTRLATHVKLRNKLGSGISGELVLRHRAASNLQNNSAHDDFLLVDYDSNRFNWDSLVNQAFPKYIEAMGAYFARLSYFELMPEEWRQVSAIERLEGLNLDGRDGVFRFGPLTYLDAQMCERTCMGMSASEVVSRLSGGVHAAYELFGGAVIVATPDYPSIDRFFENDQAIRSILGVPFSCAKSE